nr:nucleoside deaminase [Burkholderia stagnalis]
MVRGFDRKPLVALMGSRREPMTQVLPPTPPHSGPADPGDADLAHLRRSFVVATHAAKRGNAPFGAVVASPSGTVLVEAGNRVGETGDCTAHAELVAVRIASAKFSPAELRKATIYASAEPCVMCSGAIYWSGIRRIVYGIDAVSLRRLHGETANATDVELSPRQVFAASPHDAQIVGPLLVDEAALVHRVRAGTKRS